MVVDRWKIGRRERVVDTLPVEACGLQPAKLAHVGRRLVREAAVGPVEGVDVLLKQSLAVKTEVPQDRKVDKQVLAGHRAVDVGDKEPDVFESQTTRGQMEDGAWYRPRTRERELCSFDLLCERYLEMDCLDSLELANTIDGGRLGQLLGDKGLVAATVAATDDVEVHPDVLHSHPERRSVTFVRQVVFRLLDAVYRLGRGRGDL